MRENNEVKFGWWKAADGECFLLHWDRSTGWLDLNDDHIARIKSEQRVVNVLAGWETHLGEPNGLQWLTARIDSAR